MDPVPSGRGGPLSQFEVQNAHEQGEAERVGLDYHDIELKKSVHRPQGHICGESENILRERSSPSCVPALRELQIIGHSRAEGRG
jgi:hypothetical protein